MASKFVPLLNEAINACCVKKKLFVQLQSECCHLKSRLLGSIFTKQTRYGNSKREAVRSVACRGGRTGRRPRATQAGGHPKSEISKI